MDTLVEKNMVFSCIITNKNVILRETAYERKYGFYRGSACS